MKRTSVVVCLAALAVLLLLSLAEAARLGGGRSFGSRSTYSRSFSRPVAPSSGYAQPGQTQGPAQMAQPRPATAPPLGAQQPGMFSRMGWGLGGLVAGGLLGSMLFGGGMGGWGAGGGIGLLDILLIGLVIFFAVKLLRRRKQEQGGSVDVGPGGFQAPQASEDARTRAEQSWDALRSQPETRSAGGFGPGVAPAGPGPEPVVPNGFNVPEFLEGAKSVYARLQHAWDRRDLADIALFTTPEVLEEIRRQAVADPGPSKTELLLINARLLEFKEEPGDTVLSVLFDVLMREAASEDRPKQVREVWHFSRPTGNLEVNWRLEGIQQLEA
ncbi:MAG: 39S ribosomal protein L45 [Proteobacteria bacterium]|nr:39S ribosomal protein L45 [Pseudomonadota bacterium]MBU1594786.1 39S ribosomal protein L45 [Pseudomonadota bacterium]